MIHEIGHLFDINDYLSEKENFIEIYKNDVLSFKNTEIYSRELLNMNTYIISE